MSDGGDPDDGEKRDAASDTDPADSEDGDEAAGEDADRTGVRDGVDADGRGSPGPDEQYCASCGEIIKQRAEICPHCGVRNTVGGGSRGEKDRATAGILAILLGFVGAHRFYLGDTGLGILYLCFFWTGIPAIVGLIEGILYLTKSDEEFQRKYVD